MAADLPTRRVGVDYAAGPGRSTCSTRVGCTVEPPTATSASAVDAADLAARPAPTRPTWSRRWSGWTATTRCPSVLPLAPARQRPDRRAAPPPLGRPRAGRGRATSRCCRYPFVGAAALDALGLADDDPRRAAVRLANPLSEEEPLLRTTLLPPLLATLRRNVGRGAPRPRALRDRAWCSSPRVGAGAPPAMGVDDRPDRRGVRRRRRGACRAQPWHVAVVLAGEVEPAGWWGAGRPATWADAVEAARDVLDAAGMPAATGRRCGPPRMAPWHPGRCAELAVDGVVVGHAGELHPAVCAALDLPKRTVRDGARPRRAAAGPGDARRRRSPASRRR